jgi:nitroreductase/NAD-dependent dihydropyrimidine dehydrogenase PreA subunit
MRKTMNRLIAGIDSQKCINCEKCILDCPETLFFRKSEKADVTFTDPLQRCIQCGHCIAVCPKGAILYDHAESPLTHPELASPEKIFKKDDFELFIRARRSIRQFYDRGIPEKSIEFILSTMRFSPTGSNKQALHFTVITSRSMIAEFSGKVVGLFKAIKVLLVFMRVLIPFGHKKKGSPVSDAMYQTLGSALQKAKSGADPIFYRAPCVIVLSAPSYAHQSPVDAGIALAHGMFAAQAEGLGSLLVGFAHETLLLNPRLRRRLKLPAWHRPQGVMALGFPKVRYTTAPMRKPLSVTRL